MMAVNIVRNYAVEPVFARPEMVIPFSSQAAFTAFLESQKVPLHTWQEPEKKLLDLWNEVEHSDAVYTMCTRSGGEKVPTRFLLTVSARITTTIGQHCNMSLLHVLTEFVRDNDVYRPRKYTSTSLSEKMHLNKNGIPLEYCAETLRRCLAEEVGLLVPIETVKHGLSVIDVSTSAERAEAFPFSGSAGVELDFHEKSALPGLWHCNQIAQYSCSLPNRFHFMGMRQDKHTKYLSRWLSVHEPNQLAPIPVELVFTV